MADCIVGQGFLEGEKPLVSCWKCGVQLAENAKYCHNCGAAVKTRVEEFCVSADALIEKVKQLIHEGNITRIVIKDDRGKTLFEMPATVGVILAPWLAALGAIAASATRCTIVVERAE